MITVELVTGPYRAALWITCKRSSALRRRRRECGYLGSILPANIAQYLLSIVRQPIISSSS